MKTVDAFLSRKAQAVWPSAVVYKLDTGRFVIERANGEIDLDLGGTFGEARASVEVLVRSEQVKQKNQSS